MVQKVSKKAVEIEVPERLWVQLYGDTPMSTVQVNTYRSDPREVHDNGKPVYQYVLVDAPNTRQRAERATDKLRSEGLIKDSVSLIRVDNIIAAEFDK